MIIYRASQQESCILFRFGYGFLAAVFTDMLGRSLTTITRSHNCSYNITKRKNYVHNLSQIDCTSSTANGKCVYYMWIYICQARHLALQLCKHYDSLSTPTSSCVLQYVYIFDNDILSTLKSSEQIQIWCNNIPRHWVQAHSNSSGYGFCLRESGCLVIITMQ